MTEPPRRLLAVDYGDSRTGLAATDWTGSITVPLPRIDERDTDALVAALVDLVRERETQLVVLGMPFCVDGSVGERAQKTKAFEQKLAAALPCPIATVDESHTTDEAHERLKAGGLKASKRKQFADSIAALVILERYRSTPR